MRRRGAGVGSGTVHRSPPHHQAITHHISHRHMGLRCNRCSRRRTLWDNRCVCSGPCTSRQPGSRSRHSNSPSRSRTGYCSIPRWNDNIARHSRSHPGDNSGRRGNRRYRQNDTRHWGSRHRRGMTSNTRRCRSRPLRSHNNWRCRLGLCSMDRAGSRRCRSRRRSCPDNTGRCRSMSLHRNRSRRRHHSRCCRRSCRCNPGCTRRSHPGNSPTTPGRLCSSPRPIRTRS